MFSAHKVTVFLTYGKIISLKNKESHNPTYGLRLCKHIKLLFMKVDFMSNFMANHLLCILHGDVVYCDVCRRVQSPVSCIATFKSEDDFRDGSELCERNCLPSLLLHSVACEVEVNGRRLRCSDISCRHYFQIVVCIVESAGVVVAVLLYCEDVCCRCVRDGCDASRRAVLEIDVGS